MKIALVPLVIKYKFCKFTEQHPHHNKKLKLIFWGQCTLFITTISGTLVSLFLQDFNIELALKPKVITDGLRYSLATGNWGDQKKAHQSRAGVSQVLNRLTFASTLSHLRRLNSPIGREGKLARPRQLHNTHWGMICPAETPEGHAVGLVKNLALMAYISVGSQPSPILEFLEEWTMENLEEITPSAIAQWVFLYWAQLFQDQLVLTSPGLNFNVDIFFCWLKALSGKFSVFLLEYLTIKLQSERIRLNLLFKLLYLNSNFALTLAYLNPALNNLALMCNKSWTFGYWTYVTFLNFSVYFGSFLIGHVHFCLLY